MNIRAHEIRIEEAVAQAFDMHPQLVQDYLKDSATELKFWNTIMRQSLQIMRGHANPAWVADEIRKRLNELQTV